MDQTKDKDAAPELFPIHRADLEKSGLSRDIIRAAELRSLSGSQAKAALGFMLPGVESVLEIPYGKTGFSRYKLFPPGKDALGKGAKYLQAKNSGVHLYIPPGLEELLADITVPLYFTEGEKKALKAAQEGLCCVALGGVNNWKLRGAQGPIADIRDIPMRGRSLRVAHDSDFASNVNVLQAVYSFGRALEPLGAQVEVVCIPEVEGGDKVGLDDYLATHSRAEFEALPRIKLEHETFQEALRLREPEWDVPVPFDEYKLPVFPVEVLPDWLRAFVIAESEATQTPQDLSAMLSLSALATACAKRVRVLVRPGYTEPVNLFTVTVLGPGNRKSSVFAEVIAPIVDYEEQEFKRVSPELCEAKSQTQIAEQELRHAEALAAKTDGEERDVLVKEAGAKAIALAGIQLPTVPRFLTDDTTPERLASLLHEQGGRMAVMSPEGDVFDIMSGRYSGAPNFAVYLKGHAGDTIRVDRVSRPPEYVRSPALTLGLAVQPDVISGLMAKPSLRGRGLLARFLYSLPTSPIGRRKVAPESMPEEIRSAYQRRIRGLLLLPMGTTAEGEPEEHVLRLSVAAERRFRQFEAWMEPKLGQLEELGNIADWSAKLSGAVARLSGLLHLAEHADSHSPWSAEVSDQTLERAVKVAEYLIPHAQAAFAQMGADPAVDGAKYILKWLARQGFSSLTKRGIFNGTRGRFKKVENLEGPLRVLIEHGYIRLMEQGKASGAGRKPSPVYSLNPAVLLGSDTRNPQNETTCQIADSAETADAAANKEVLREVVRAEAWQQAKSRVEANWVEGTDEYLKTQQTGLLERMATAEDQVDAAWRSCRDGKAGHEAFTAALQEWEVAHAKASEVMRSRELLAVAQELI